MTGAVTREYLQVAIAPGCEKTFAALEGRMGMPLAGGDNPDDAWWFAKVTPDGGTIRAYAFASWQRVDLGGLVGQLDGADVRATVGLADLTGFRVEGPGAALRGQTGRPPILRPDQIDRLYLATKRVRLR